MLYKSLSTSLIAIFGRSVRHQLWKSAISRQPEASEPYYMNTEVDVQRAHSYKIMKIKQGFWSHDPALGGSLKFPGHTKSCWIINIFTRHMCRVWWVLGYVYPNFELTETTYRKNRVLALINWQVLSTKTELKRFSLRKMRPNVQSFNQTKRKGGWLTMTKLNMETWS